MENMKLYLPMSAQAVLHPWSLRTHAFECQDAVAYGYLGAFVFAVLGLLMLIGVETDGATLGYTHADYAAFYLIVTLTSMAFLVVASLARKDARVLLRASMQLELDEERQRREKHEAYLKQIRDESNERIRQSAETHARYMGSLKLVGGVQ